MQPKQIPSPFVGTAETEHHHQVRLFQWVNKATRHGFDAAWDPLTYQDFKYTLTKYGTHDRVDDLKYMFAIPNGGLRNKVTAMKLVAEGVKKGAPDIMLPIRRDPYIGLFVEMKKPKGVITDHNRKATSKGVVSDEQKDYIAFLTQQGYECEICYTWAMAATCVEKYYQSTQTN